MAQAKRNNNNNQNKNNNNNKRNKGNNNANNKRKSSAKNKSNKSSPSKNKINANKANKNRENRANNTNNNNNNGNKQKDNNAEPMAVEHKQQEVEQQPLVPAVHAAPAPAPEQRMVLIEPEFPSFTAMKECLERAYNDMAFMLHTFGHREGVEAAHLCQRLYLAGNKVQDTIAEIRDLARSTGSEATGYPLVKFIGRPQHFSRENLFIINEHRWEVGLPAGEIKVKSITFTHI